MELTQTEKQVKISLIQKCLAVVGTIATENMGEAQAFDMLYDMDLPALGATLATLEQRAKERTPELEKEKRIVELKTMRQWNEDAPLIAIYEKHKEGLITEWRNLTGKFNFP